MAKAVIMPKFGFTQETAEILKWLVPPGSPVEAGDPIAEVSTDKVDMEVEAPVSGILDGIRYQEGDTVPVTAVIAYIRQPEETLPPDIEAEAVPTTSAVETPAASPPAARASKAAPLITPVAARIAEEHGIDVNTLQGSGPGGRITRKDVEASLGQSKIRAAPAARRLAREYDLDLSTISGTGPRGRIQSWDVQAARETGESQSPTLAAEGVEVIPLAGIRRSIAQRMQQSWQQAPHMTFSMDVDVSAMQELRRRVNARLPEDAPGVSLTAILVKICAWALRRHPRMNAHFDGDRILVFSDINIGIAVALEEGLIVPVIHQVDQKGLQELAHTLRDISRRARTGKLRAHELQGGTFTISNLGMYGIDRFSAIINPPETGILAVGRIIRRPVVNDDDSVVIRPMLTLTLSADHRSVDGAIAAHFLDDLRSALEHPEILIL